MAQYSFEKVRRGYMDLWNSMTVTKVKEASDQAHRIFRDKARYQAVEKTTSVPWFVIGCLHMRESNADFNRWLHNGDPMRNKQGRPIKTVHVPPGRPPNPDVTWEQGAYDALVTVQHLDRIKEWGPDHVAYALEDFNGWGYRHPKRNIPSPYLWGGTSVQKRGKFIRDGEYDANTMDTQLGGMAVLKQLLLLYPHDVRWTRSAPIVPPPPPQPPAAPIIEPKPEPVEAEAQAPMSPAAVDKVDGQVRPASRSKTVWGALMGYGATVVTAITNALAYLNNPYTLAAFALVIIIASIGLWLVLSGRLELKKLVEHLAEDETT